MEDRLTDNVSQVPILGNLPLIGQLFRRNQKDKTKTELLIFLSPHVAFNPDNLKPMSEDELHGTKLTPHAVEPGAFEEQIRGMRRGEVTTRPATTQSQENPDR